VSPLTLDWASGGGGGGGGQLTEFIAPAVVALTDAATILVNAALGNDFRVTLGGSRIMGAPSNPADGQDIAFVISQPGSGGPWSVTWAGAYQFGTAGAPPLSTAASAVDIFSFKYDLSLTEWLFTGAVTTAASVVPLTQGGTGQVTRQAAINALLASVTSGTFARGNGTNVVMAAIQAADVPTLNQSTTGNAGTATNLAGGATFPDYVAPAVTALTFGASIAVNAALGNVFAVTLTASTGTLANPTNPVDGQLIRVRVAQDATGSRTLAYGTAYDWGAAGAPTLSTAANKVDILVFEYNAALSKWCGSSALGF
jgi:hypothetical protein